jgi:hypothetical protein
LQIELIDGLLGNDWRRIASAIARRVAKVVVVPLE